MHGTKIHKMQWLQYPNQSPVDALNNVRREVVDIPRRRRRREREREREK
jgi:hypothetical protein